MVHEFSDDGLSVHWRVIDVNTGEVLSEGDLDLGAHGSVASPDGSTVAVAGETGEIATIDVRPGTNGGDPPASVPRCCWLNYSDDGELLVSGADDGGVSLWDATTLELLGTVYPPHRASRSRPARISSATATTWPSRRTTASVYRWETDLERAIDFACQMAGRNLTRRSGKSSCPPSPTSPSAPTSERRSRPSIDVGHARDWAAATRSDPRPCNPSPRPSGRSDAAQFATAATAAVPRQS